MSNSPEVPNLVLVSHQTVSRLLSSPNIHGCATAEGAKIKPVVEANLVCDPRENQRKLASTSMGKNHRELARRPFHHFSMCGVLFFILCEPHEKICCMNFAHDV